MRTALVTGSSRGIGRAIAIRLAKDGFKVIVHGAGNIEKLEETKSIIEQNGGSAEALVCDLTNLESTKEFCEKVRDIDVLILNASLQYRTPWQQISLDECFKQINCNFVSNMMLVQSTADYMKKNKWGRIITIGSVQEAKPHPDMLVYSSMKAAQTQMAISLSLQLAKDGITVNNVAPGIINTDRNTDALSNPDYLKKILDGIPAGYYAEPEDCVGIISLLCGEEGRYITGQNIFVDGGMGIK